MVKSIPCSSPGAYHQSDFKTFRVRAVYCNAFPDNLVAFKCPINEVIVMSLEIQQGFALVLAQFVGGLESVHVGSPAGRSIVLQH
jgi:hypothetical protein